MPFDPNLVTPAGKTYAEIDASQARDVAAANEALALLRGLGCRWWSYSLSHRTFELVIGDPVAGGPNLVISLADCDRIGGPVSWADQQLRVTWDNGRERNEGWKFTLRDDAADFVAIGGVFRWRRDFDIHKDGSLYFGRPVDPSAGP